MEERSVADTIDELANESPQAPALIRELFRVLPPVGEQFSLEHRVAWLMGAAALFDVVYADGAPPARVRVVDGKVMVMQ
jgi:hypothetical protein